MAGIGRRRFLTYGAGLLVPAAGFGAVKVVDWSGSGGAEAGAAPLAPSLPGTEIPRFRERLPVLPAMPRTRRLTSGGRDVDYYEVAQRQFMQQVLPRGLPQTKVWGYGSANHPETFHAPGPSFEARVGTPTRVRWINDLRSRSGRYLPHILPVDPTLHWANPGGGRDGRDGMPSFDETPGPYTGPVPMVVHLHGGERTTQESDGYPEAWYLPDAVNVPARYAKTGSVYDRFRESSPLGEEWGRGSATFEYPNQQDAATLWYHDHVLGMTRLNIYAGLAGMYLLRGDEATAGLPGPAPAEGDARGQGYREVPLVIQDRSFNADGSLFYPGSRAVFDGYGGPYVPDSEVPPLWVPGFLGDTMVVNGRTWPYLEVEPRRYRFRVLNGCGARFLVLENDAGLPFWQVGSDGGFLPAPARLERLLLGPAERADVVVDFSQVPVGETVTLLNLGPGQGPYPGGVPGEDFAPSDPATTGQVLQFRIVAATGPDTSTPPDQLRFRPTTTAAAATGQLPTRRVSLNEMHSDATGGHLMGSLGTVDGQGSGEPLRWHDEVTETPAAGTTEVWEVYNLTPEAHPVHVHATQFEVVSRQSIRPGSPVREPEAWETGRKDTVVAHPATITRLRAHFPQAGLYVWHCHITEHEDNDMMRPLRIGSDR